MRAAADLTGVQSDATSMADVDGDGNLDLLITGDDEAEDETQTARLYLGNGNGNFSVANAGLTGVSQGATSIGDVDGDGDQDLLITGGTASFGEDPSATLYLGDGQGGFSAANAGLTGVYDGDASIADVDGDENQDLLITGADSDRDPNTTLYLGDGQGGFSEANADLTGVNGSSASIADVDEDGNQDLLITGFDANDNHTATLYLGDGQGGFSEANARLTGVGDASTSISDVEGDGNQDLLITGYDGSNASASLYLGDGQGSFSEANAGLTGVESGSTSIADVDGDGNLDLLITGRDANDSRTATLYLGDGQGGFSKANAGLTGTSGSISTGDLYGDGDPDFLLTGWGALFDNLSARLYVNRTNQSTPNRSPRFAQTFDYGPLAPGLTLKRTIEAGDPDGDALSLQRAQGPSSFSVNDAGNGVADVTFAPNRSQGGETFDIRIEARDSDGATQSFSRSIRVPPVVAARPGVLAGVQSSATSIADVDGDGNLDLLITGEDEAKGLSPSARLYLGDGQRGVTGANVGLTGVYDGSTSIADVNGDGNQDLLIVGNAGRGTGATAILYLGNGQGSFSEANAGLTGIVDGSSTSVADVDEDGNQDLLITGRNSDFDPSTTLYLGNGQGGFSKVNAGLTDVERSSTSIADVDGDGNQDLLITGMVNFNETATLYLGDGQGGFSEANAGLTGVRGGSTSVADVDGDGNQDLLITGVANFNETAILYLGDGQGGFSEANAGLAGVFDGSTSIADVNGDGNQDLLITGEDAVGNRMAALYLGDGQGGFSRANAGLSGVEGSSTSIGDVDGDDDPDLLVTGFSSASRSPASILYENLFNNPLPVELVGFTATMQEGAVRLTWQTVSETGNARFEVQRRVASAPGVRRTGEGAKGREGAWTTVGSVEGAGTTSEPQSYRFTDADLPYAADRLEYRLRQVDTDGTTHLSKTVTVERAVDEVQLLGTYPNPAQSQATVRYALPEKEDVTLRLYDVLGRQVRTLAEGKQEGRHEQQLDTSGLPSGTYFLRLEAGGQTRTQKLTVVR